MASIFGKRWQKWTAKEVKKASSGSTLLRDKPNLVYEYGQRSCHIDSRFDASRISFKDPRNSLEESCDSWDEQMFDPSIFLPVSPMLSIVEDPPVPMPKIHVLENFPSVKYMNGKGDLAPGGLIKTKEYYADTKSRRRKSINGSNSSRKGDPVVTSPDYLIGSKEKLKSQWIDDFWGAFEFGDENAAASHVSGNLEKKEMKKSRKWNWNFMNFIQKCRSGNGMINKDKYEEEEEEIYNGGKRRIGKERSYSQYWKQDRMKDFGYKPRCSSSISNWANTNTNMNVNKNGGGLFSFTERKSSAESGRWMNKLRLY